MNLHLLSPIGVAEHLYLLERHVGTIIRLAHIGDAAGMRPVQLVYDSHYSASSLVAILPSFRRTVEKYDGMGEVLTAPELGLRSTRLVVRELAGPAMRQIQEHKSRSILGSMFQRMITHLQQDVKEIDDIWIPHRMTVRNQELEPYLAAITHAWDRWGATRNNLELLTVLQEVLSAKINRVLTLYCEAILKIFHCYTLDVRDEGIRRLVERVILST